MFQEHYLNAHCSRSIFAICSWSIVHSNMLLEYIYYMLLEHCAFTYICSWSISNLEITPDYIYSKSMLLEHMFLEQLLLEHNLGPKSHRSNTHCKWYCDTVEPLKGCGMCPWLVLVSPCFRENVVATCKIVFVLFCVFFFFFFCVV